MLKDQETASGIFTASANENRGKPVLITGPGISDGGLWPEYVAYVLVLASLFLFRGLKKSFHQGLNRPLATLFIAEEVDGAGDMVSGDSTTDNAQTILQAFLNIWDYIQLPMYQDF
jgi:hypothetical protein